MVRIEEANKRLFNNVFVCKKCKAKIRTQNQRVLTNSVKCRKCGSKELRPKKSKKFLV